MIPDDRTRIGDQDRNRLQIDRGLKPAETPQKPETSDDDQRKKSKFREALSNSGPEKPKQKISSEKEETKKASLFSMASEEFEKSKKVEGEVLDPAVLLAAEEEPTPTKVNPMAFTPLEQQKPIEVNIQAKSSTAIEDSTSKDTGKKGQDAPEAQVTPVPYKDQTIAIAPVNTTTPKEQTTPTRDALIRIVEQVTDAIKQITLPDRTTTEITLTRPPLFAGVTLSVTEFTAAKNQFNLTFHNLTNPVARQMIELHDNQVFLREQLLSKGYTLQTITIEPKLDIVTHVDHTELREQRGFDENPDEGKKEEP